MAFDTHSLLAYSTVIGGGVINSTTGNSLQVNSGDSTKFAIGQNVTVWPSGVEPNIGTAGVTRNAEIMRITSIDNQSDTLTVTRAQESLTPALSNIAIGYQIANTITPKVLTDIESGGKLAQTAFAPGALYLGLGTDTGATLTASLVTHATVTATSHGNAVMLIWGAQVGNGNSGNDRSFTMQITCDGVTTGITPSSLTFDSPFISGTTTTLYYGFVHSHTPAAGAHTWNLQFQASAGASVILGQNFLYVAEVV